eukprot:CAMPEP_0174357392 /NCGR_PEP_ID=MMETSP0811_2-20130205/35822_1 /TAXON_ID=73025 ORGANISM="Eutreptiella gymnastica-like, Strain CCMP1594" /NCGR_SAMPLE_ID=MMETSP0811_2 /ASSEMBLY_ACC=CAM_ASM_000667 /LENGTH=103 /DNA_ID=CAMNT_0015490179 /DNA_START=562 /DNA_END=871 /DNA_ORIENTATION=-
MNLQGQHRRWMCLHCRGGTNVMEEPGQHGPAGQSVGWGAAAVQSGRPELGGKAGALHITLDHAHDTERVRRGTACVRWPPASTLTSSRNPTVRGFDLLTSDTW